MPLKVYFRAKSVTFCTSVSQIAKVSTERKINALFKGNKASILADGKSTMVDTLKKVILI